MNSKTLTRNLMIARHNPFCLHIQAECYPLRVYRLNDTADDLTHLALEILHLVGAFGFTDALLDDLTRGLGAAEARTEAANYGAYTANGAYLSLPGQWQISAAVRRPDAFDVFADYRVRVNLDGQIEPLGQTGPIDALVKWLSIYGMMFGGIMAVAIGAAWLFIAWKAADHPAALAVLVILNCIAIFSVCCSIFCIFCYILLQFCYSQKGVPAYSQLL